MISLIQKRKRKMKKKCPDVKAVRSKQLREHLLPEG